MAFSSEVKQIITDGSPGQPCYELAWQDNTGGGIPCFAARDCNIGEAAVAEFTCNWKTNDVTSRSRAGFGVMRDLPGKGVAVVIENNGGWVLSIGTATSWADYGSMTTTVAVAPAAGLVANAWFRMHIKCVVNADRSFTVTATVRSLLDADLATLTATVNIDRGDYFGFYGTFDQLGGTSKAWFDHIKVDASGSTNYVAVNTATSYVYTFVSDLGEESPPSPASATVLRPDGILITVTTPTTVPGGADPQYSLYGIVTKRIYRSVTGATGTIFLLLGEIPLAQADYIDTLDDSEIADSDVLESDEWDLPPAGMQGIIALPNGIMAGFWRNLLCLSEVGRPHAWPVRYRKPTDTDIVAIANIDNTIVIGTKSFLYTATGNSPDGYSMSKPGDPQACVSKRSMVFMPDQGVVYASPDGMMVCAGSAGQVRNATSSIYTKRQWQALDPASMICAVHDGVLFFFVTGPTPDAGYALDTKADGFGLIRLSFHAIAAHVDPLTDALYLVLDLNSEPTDSDLPLASTAVVASNKTIFEFDAGASAMVFRWRGRLNLSPYPLALTMAQVRALDYTNLLVRIYGDGAVVFEKVLANMREFVLPLLGTHASYELELMGTSTTRGGQAVEDVMELG